MYIVFELKVYILESAMWNLCMSETLLYQKIVLGLPLARVGFIGGRRLFCLPPGIQLPSP